MSRTDNLRKLNDENYNNSVNSLEHLNLLADETRRMGEVFKNTEEIITDLDKEFSKKTGIYNRKDLIFLFIATGLLCAKWVIMGIKMPLDFDFLYDPATRTRITHDAGDKLAEAKLKNHKKYGLLDFENDISKSGCRTISQIILNPVPYDAIGKFPDLASAAIGLGGPNHRLLTFGHDPVLGWLFGTLDILTGSLTRKSPFSTYKVLEKGNVMSRLSSFPEELGTAVVSIHEDGRRLPAAVFKQGCHIVSDRYTKLGLPIPCLNPEKASELLKRGWSYEDVDAAIKKFVSKSAKLLGTVALQFSVSFLINLIIKAVHLMFYDETKDDTIEMYEVRTRRILRTANIIASSSNILVSAGIAIGTGNVAAGAKLLDIGGFIETIHRLVSDTKFINQIKREYVINNFEKQVFNREDSEFEWLYAIFDEIEGEI